MWNDTDVPLAHLITFRCYGTWLHGDSRGSIDRFHNRYRSPYIEPNKNWHRYKTAIMESKPVTLDAARRRSVKAAILETCTDRKWQLHALNLRTNHVHIVVSIGSAKPALALAALKAKSTKRRRQDGCWRQESSPWADKGSKRPLWNERSVARAIEYVLHGQGDELPDFNKF